MVMEQLVIHVHPPIPKPKNSTQMLQISQKLSQKISYTQNKKNLSLLEEITEGNLEHLRFQKLLDTAQK